MHSASGMRTGVCLEPAVLDCHPVRLECRCVPHLNRRTDALADRPAATGAGTWFALISEVLCSDSLKYNAWRSIMIPHTITDYLERNLARYSVMPHPAAYTAQEEAAAAHVPGHAWAKAVVCVADDQLIL